jgi:hypothetical protein
MKSKLFFLLICTLLCLSITACTEVDLPADVTDLLPDVGNPPTNTSVPEPTAVPPTETPLPTATNTPAPTAVPVVRQWAMAASASSEYNNPEWGAIQAVGEPDTDSCADLTTAWASETSYGVDWLELTYAAPVIPTEINIYQSYTPDFVTRVEVLDIRGNYWEVYSAAGATLTECPYVLTIPVTSVTEYVYGVRVTIDQTNASYWNEIDAVELVGIPDSTGQVTIPPTATAIPFVAGECEGDALPIDMNTDIEFSVQAGTYPDTCEFYCLWVPENGTRLDIGILNFDVDLDLYVDTNISVLAFEDHGQWQSNAYGEGDEAISIFTPGGRYYIQVCSYEGLASSFLLHNLFVP